MKLCYILPKFDMDAGEHVVHKYKLLSEIGKKCTMSVFIEKCRGIPTFKNAKEVVCVQQKKFVSRFVETIGKLTRLRMQGYNTFFVHYSFFGAIAGSMITKLTGGTVFYWNCGLPHLFFKSFGEKDWVKSKLNDDWPLRLSLKMVDYLVTGTERMKMYYHDEFHVPLKKIVVIPNQIDLSRFAPQRPKNKVPVILFVHRISERKGANYIVPIADFLQIQQILGNNGVGGLVSNL